MNRMMTLLLIFMGTVFSLFLSTSAASAQTTRPSAAFHKGQKVYIVAFRDSRPLVVDQPNGGSSVQPTQEHFLDLEKKVDEEMQKWGYFPIAERPSDAELVLLVYTDMSSIEGLLVSPEDFRLHYKEKFDLDELRDVAIARGTAGPLNLATLGRLSDRMVKQLRVKVEAGGH